MRFGRRKKGPTNPEPRHPLSPEDRSPAVENRRNDFDEVSAPDLDGHRDLGAQVRGGQFSQVPPGVDIHDPNAHRPEPIDTTVTETAIDEKTLTELRQIAARYPQSRSALLPMLHLVQSVDGRVTPAGVEACAEILGISTADVSSVATFYTMYKRRPNGEYNVGVCTTALCAIMGGDDIFERLSKELGIGHDETTPDGKITLERVECNAACDYAPVVMINWEFMDNQSPESAVETVTKIRHGVEITSTRGARICTWKQAERVLAGYPDDRADEGPTSGAASQLGIRLAAENNWRAPTPEEAAAALAAAREAEGEEESK